MLNAQCYDSIIRFSTKVWTSVKMIIGQDTVYSTAVMTKMSLEDSSFMFLIEDWNNMRVKVINDRIFISRKCPHFNQPGIRVLVKGKNKRTPRAKRLRRKRGTDRFAAAVWSEGRNRLVELIKSCSKRLCWHTAPLRRVLIDLPRKLNFMCTVSHTHSRDGCKTLSHITTKILGDKRTHIHAYKHKTVHKKPLYEIRWQ